MAEKQSAQKENKKESGQAAARKRKNRKVISKGLVYIKASFNNTIITFADLQGNTLLQFSSGAAGFSGSRKHTPYAAQVAAGRAANLAKEEYKMEEVDVEIRGPGPGRESAVRVINDILKVGYVKDKTALPHNGCRPPKARRV